MTKESTKILMERGAPGSLTGDNAGQTMKASHQGDDKKSGLRTTRRSAASSEVVRVRKSKGLEQNSHLRFVDILPA